MEGNDSATSFKIDRFSKADLSGARRIVAFTGREIIMMWIAITWMACLAYVLNEADRAPTID